MRPASRVGNLSRDGPRGSPSPPHRPALPLAGQAGWRRDLALPAVLLVVQLAGAAATVTGHHSPARHLGPADWVLLVAGPLALVFRRRWPVAVLWVAFVATLTPSGAWSANLSLIAAFFLAATSGHRRAAWVVIAVGYLCSVWLAPLAYGNPTGSLTFALALAGWLAVLVIATEVVRLRRERTVETRATRALDARRRASEERLQMARDLHDVIGHNISLINVQAGVGLDLMDTHPEQARAALAAIKAVSKDALDELRTMLAAPPPRRRGSPSCPRARPRSPRRARRGDPRRRHPGHPADRRRGPGVARRSRPGRLPHRAGVPDQRGPPCRSGHGYRTPCSWQRRARYRGVRCRRRPQPPADPSRELAVASPGCASAPMLSAAAWRQARAQVGGSP